jgi:3-oxoacyl-[acyl-carrier protein] reductase
MGLACCQRFAEEGAEIVIGDLLDDAGERAVSAVSDVGGKAVFVHLDAANRDDNEALMRAAVDTFGALDILVAAAGITNAGYRSGDVESQRRLVTERQGTPVDPTAQIIDFPLDDWYKVLEVNLTGTLFALQTAARRMRDGGRGGSIITFSAIAAKVPGLTTISYSVSKAGVWVLTKNAAIALAPAGIRVNSIGPGVIETNMTATLKDMPEAMASLMARTPMGRAGTPREVANAALFLASEESSYFTGEMFHPDGGFFTD